MFLSLDTTVLFTGMNTASRGDALSSKISHLESLTRPPEGGAVYRYRPTVVVVVAAVVVVLVLLLVLVLVVAWEGGIPIPAYPGSHGKLLRWPRTKNT